MRELIGSFLILFVLVALTILGIAYGYPDHPYAVGTIMILAACYAIYLHERTYVRRNMIERAKRDADRIIRAMRIREFLAISHYPALWGVTAGLWAAFSAMFIWHCTLTTFLVVGAGAFVLAFIASMAIERLVSGSRRTSIG